MSQAAPTLSQHLLTRSDLARLEVSAGEVLRWLANGWLEVIGALPSTDCEGNPVFAITEVDLRIDLAGRLQSIGKDEVVYSVLRVRSVLGRTLMALSQFEAQTNGDTDEAPETPAPVEAEAPEEPSDDTDGADYPSDEPPASAVDEEAICTGELLGPPTIDECLAMAREEARRDALDLEVELAHTDTAAPELDTADELTEEAEFFDFRELGDALDSWEGENPPMTADDEPMDEIQHDATEELETGWTEKEQLAETTPAATDTIAEEPLSEFTPADEGIVPPEVVAALLEEEALTESESEILDDEGEADLADESAATEAETNEDQPEPIAEETVEPGTVEEVAETDPEAEILDDEETVEPETIEEAVEPAQAVEEAVEPETIEEAVEPVHAVEETVEGAEEGSASEDEPDSDLSESEPEEPIAEAENAAATDIEEEDEAFVEPEVVAALEADEPLEDELESPPELAAETEPAPEPEPEADEVEDPVAEAEPETVLESPAQPSPSTEPEPEFAATAVAQAEPLERVESFLGELRTTLVDLVQQPQSPPPTVDMGPLVNAVGEFGQRVEHGVAVGVHAAMSSQAPAAPSAAVPMPIAPSRSNRSTMLMLAVSVLLLGWGSILWWKTGNLQLALATVVGANLVGCCLLVGRR